MFHRTTLVAAGLFLLALLVLLSLEYRLGIPLAGVSRASYFTYQAAGWLQGRWSLNLPASLPDLITLHGQSYMYYPPFPALLLLPFVAIFGLSTSDILLTTVLSAANLSLLYLLFDQARTNGFHLRPRAEQVALSIFCYFGSISLYLSLGGTVWFTAQIVGMTCTLLALLLALRGQYGWSAALLGCAFFSRYTAILAFPLLCYLAWEDAGREPMLGRFLASVRRRAPEWQAVPWQRLLPVGIVTALVGVLFLVHNQVVFGSPLDTGYQTLIQQRYPQVTDGLFSLSYVPGNMITLFFSFPHTLFYGSFDHYVATDFINGGFGESVFITTPLFLFLFWRNKQKNALRVALWLPIVLDVLAMLLFYNEGWYQFGVRYLFDVYPFAFLLLLLNEIQMDWRFAVLGLLGILINVIAAFQFWPLWLHM